MFKKTFLGKKFSSLGNGKKKKKNTLRGTTPKKKFFKKNNPSIYLKKNCFFLSDFFSPPTIPTGTKGLKKGNKNNPGGAISLLFICAKRGNRE